MESHDNLQLRPTADRDAQRALALDTPANGHIQAIRASLLQGSRVTVPDISAYLLSCLSVPTQARAIPALLLRLHLSVRPLALPTDPPPIRVPDSQSVLSPDLLR